LVKKPKLALWLFSSEKLDDRVLGWGRCIPHSCPNLEKGGEKCRNLEKTDKTGGKGRFQKRAPRVSALCNP